MNTTGQDRLYHLLPALYRQVDEHQGEPLRALLSVLESEFHHLETDIGAMYDDWFIETCDLWVVPYIANLLGVRDIQDVEHIPSQRRLVANNIAYRRRKGTLGVLEKVVRDATGWYARSIEYAQLIASTEQMDGMRSKPGQTVDVSGLAKKHSVDELPHGVDVNDSDQGGYNADTIGLSLYRLRNYPIQRSFAHPVAKKKNCFTFHPLGLDMPMFNRPQPVLYTSQRAQPANLPVPIHRADLEEDLREYRDIYESLKKGDRPPESSYYGPERSFHIEMPDGYPVIKPASVASVDLSEWPATCRLPCDVIAAVDVERGRMAFMDPNQLPKSADRHDQPQAFTLDHWPSYVIVNYNYGFSTELGGGPYQREIRLPGAETQAFEIQVAMGAERPDLAKIEELPEENWPGCVPTLNDALAIVEIHRQRENQKTFTNPNRSYGVIYIIDNGVYEEKLEIKLHREMPLYILASPGVRPIVGTSKEAILISLDEIKPTSKVNLAGEIRQNEEEDLAGCQLTLNGLHLQGGLQISLETPNNAKDRLTVSIVHCTLFERKGNNLKPAPLQCQQASQNLRLMIKSSILGPLFLPSGFVKVSSCIIDNGTGYAIAADANGSRPGPRLEMEHTTIFGRVFAEKIEASGVIFCRPLRSPAPEKPEQIRNCYVPKKSATLTGEAHLSISRGLPPPHFTSTRFGDPGYGQLSLDCHPEIRRMADGSEMGVFHDLYQVLAEENLSAVLKEYLPPGLHARIRYIT